MNEFKFHTNRSFGTEQFTCSATVHSDNFGLTKEELEQSLKTLSDSLDIQLNEVIEREIKEKTATAARLQERVAANNAVRDAIAKVNLAAVLERVDIDKVNDAFQKLLEENGDEVVNKDVEDTTVSPYTENNG